MAVAIERVVRATADLRALVTELDDVLAAAYEPRQRHGLAVDALFLPQMRFFIGCFDGIAAGCGGVAFFPDHAEVKRMYTRRAARGRGVAKALLRRLEDEACGAGAPILRLETGINQYEAIGLYERTGFRRRGPFGAYADMPTDRIGTSLFFEKDLGP